MKIWGQVDFIELLQSWKGKQFCSIRINTYSSMGLPFLTAGSHSAPFLKGCHWIPLTSWQLREPLYSKKVLEWTHDPFSVSYTRRFIGQWSNIEHRAEELAPRQYFMKMRYHTKGHSIQSKLMTFL